MKKVTLFSALAIGIVFATTAFSDPFAGPVQFSGLVFPGQTDYINVNLVGGEVTLIQVWGDKDGDIDCFVYNNRGNLVAADNDDTDACLISIKVPYTAQYTLYIKNEGHVSDRYHGLMR
jgi:hypothetical protein